MANFNFNKVIIGGRLTADPEQKQTTSGISVVSFTVAVTRRGKDNETDFFNVTAWRDMAEFVSRYFRRGSSVCITGKLKNVTWTDKNGGKRLRTEILAEEISFVDSRSEREAMLENTIEQEERDADGASYATETKEDDIDLPF